MNWTTFIERLRKLAGTRAGNDRVSEETAEIFADALVLNPDAPREMKQEEERIIRYYLMQGEFPPEFEDEDAEIFLRDDDSFLSATHRFAGGLTAEDLSNKEKAEEFANVIRLVGRGGEGVTQELVGQALRVIGSALAEEFVRKLPLTGVDVHSEFEDFMEQFRVNWVAPADRAARSGGNLLKITEEGNQLYNTLKEVFLSEYEVEMEGYIPTEEPPLTWILDVVKSIIRDARRDWAEFSTEAKFEHATGRELAVDWARPISIHIKPYLRFYLKTEDKGEKLKNLWASIKEHIEQQDLSMDLRRAITFSVLAGFISALGDLKWEHEETDLQELEDTLREIAKDERMPEATQHYAKYLRKKKTFKSLLMRKLLSLLRETWGGR